MNRAAAHSLQSVVRLPRLILNNGQYRLSRQIILVDNDIKGHKPAQESLRWNSLLDGTLLHPEEHESCAKWTIHDPRSWEWTSTEVSTRRSVSDALKTTLNGVQVDSELLAVPLSPFIAQWKLPRATGYAPALCKYPRAMPVSTV